MNPRILGIIGGLALIVALLSPFLMGSSKKTERLFEAAETLYNQNDYGGAIAKYKEALKESKKRGVKTESIREDFKTFVNLRIARSYVNLAEKAGDINDYEYYEKSLEYIETASQTAKLRKHKVDLTYRWGYALYKIGDLDQAKEKLMQLIENFPNSPLVKEAEEIIEYITQKQNTGEMENIIPNSGRAPVWVNDPSRFEAFNKKNNRKLVVPNRLRAEKHYVQAAEQYEDFANTNSSTAEAVYALYWAGWCYFEAASNNEILINQASNAFQRLIDLYSNSPYVPRVNERLNDIVKWYVNEGYTHLNQERLEEATKKARDALDIDPSYQDAKKLLDEIRQEYFYQAINYIQAEEYAKAIPLLIKALNIEPFKEGYYQLGRAYLKRGKFEEAKVACKAALKIDPTYKAAKDLCDSIAD